MFKFCLSLPWPLPYSCLEHVINLANVAVMRHIMKIAIIENTNTIWEYDFNLIDNCVLKGSVDVVAAIQMLVIKVHKSAIKMDSVIATHVFSTYSSLWTAH